MNTSDKINKIIDKLYGTLDRVAYKNVSFDITMIIDDIITEGVMQRAITPLGNFLYDYHERNLKV